MYEKYDLYDYLEVFNIKGPDGRAAWTATVGTKGQIVIPREAREMFDIQPGDTLILLGDPARGIAIPPVESFDTLFGRIFGGEER